VPEIDDDLELETASDELIKKKQLEVQSNPKLTRRKPLLVMINPKSGGQVGAGTFKQNFDQIFEQKRLCLVSVLFRASILIFNFNRIEKTIFELIEP
jgi:hypothetical protein